MGFACLFTSNQLWRLKTMNTKGLAEKLVAFCTNVSEQLSYTKTYRSYEEILNLDKWIGVPLDVEITEDGAEFKYSLGNATYTTKVKDEKLKDIVSAVVVLDKSKGPLENVMAIMAKTSSGTLCLIDNLTLEWEAVQGGYPSSS